MLFLVRALCSGDADLARREVPAAPPGRSGALRRPWSCRRDFRAGAGLRTAAVYASAGCRESQPLLDTGREPPSSVAEPISRWASFWAPSLPTTG